MNTKPDEYYINQTLNRNVNAYAFLVEKYQFMVYTLAFRIIKNREEAEEVSQDVFVKSYKKLASFNGDSKFSTWLYKITYNTSLDVVKRNNRMVSTEHIDFLNDADLGTIENSLQFLENEERKEVIKKALSKLNEDEQVIVTLYYFEELSLKEISKIVNLTVDNVKIKLFRLRKKLFSILKNVIEPRTIDLI